jgi:hypothetical protein
VLSQLRKVDPELLTLAKVLGKNPEDYPEQGCQPAQIGKAANARKGDLIKYFDANKKETGHSWTLEFKDADIPTCKQKVWNSIPKILAAGYPIEDLAKEFGVNNNNKNKKKSEPRKKKNSTSRNGRIDTKPPRGVPG